MKNLIFKSSFNEKLKMLLIAIGLMVTSLTTQLAAAELKNGQYIYINYSTSTWASSSAKFRFNWYWNVGDYCCWNNEAGRVSGENYAYAQTQNAYTRAVQILRFNSTYGTQWNYTNTVAVSDNTKNCITLTASVSDNYTFSWTTYAPPMSTVTLSDNGTSIVSGSGTSGDPYLVYVSTPIKVSASGTKAVADPDATIYYDFKQSSTSKQNSTTTTYQFNASATANTSYTINLDGYTKVSSTSSTKKAATALYYKTIAAAEPTHDVTISYKYSGTTIKDATTESAVGESTSRSITAPSITGYTFSSWTKGAGVNITSGTTSSSTISITTNSSGAYTLTANYTEDLTTSWYIAGATGTNYPFTGWGTSGISMSKKTGHSTEEIYYCDVVVNRVATGNEYEFQTYNSANSTYYGYNNKDITKESNSTTVYSGNPNNMHFKPYLTGTYEFKLDNTGANPVLTVTWPVYNQVRISAASPTADAANVGNFDLGAAVSNVRSVTRSLKANDTYTFKVVSNSEWYGYNSGAFTRSTSTSSNSLTTSTSGGDMTLTTDYAGDYTFKFNESTKALSVDFPEAYKVTYGKGSVNGSSSDCSAVDIDNSNASITSNSTWVKSGHRVKLTAPSAKSGYTYDGWFDNNSGTGEAITTAANCTITVASALTRYACYHENDYTVTVAAGAGGSVASTSVIGHKDTKVTLPTATANPGYYFTGWEVTSGTATLTSSSSVTAAQINGMTDAVTVRANFAPIWRIACSSDSYNTESHQITTITTSAGAMTSGSVTIDLDANTDYEFKVYNKSTDKWWGHSGTVTKITYTNKGTAQSLSEATGNNQTFRTAGKGTYTFTWNVSNSKISIGYPTSYTVTFGYGTGGSDVTASVESSGAITSGQYAAAGKDITFTQTPATGYELKGWYTASSGGTAVSGMSKTDNVLDDIAANANVYAQYEGKTYTVSFNINGGSGATPDSKSVTYGAAYGTLPAGPTPPGADQFVGWSKTQTGTVDLVTAETIVATASNHVLYARFEHTYTVTVQYKCGTQTLRASTTVHASESAVAADISAPVILGYEFVEWTGDNATFADATSATTTVHATAATAITANYTAVPMVYFKNNLDWDNVYVSFDNTWKEIDGKQVPVNKGKPYYKMTQLGTSDIFYCEIPSDYVANNYANWKWNIAFDNTNYGSTAETTHTGTWDEFYGGKFLGRSDFDPSATMYIPYDGDTETRNSGTYYRTGCWMKYNSTDPGYTIYANTYVSGSGGTAVAGTPVLLTADVAGGFEFKGKVNFPNANYSYGFMLHKEYTKNTNDLWYTNTGAIYSTTTSLPWHFYTDGASENGQRCEIHTEAVGEYEFTVTFGTGRPVVNVTYPVGVGDWKLIYKDRATWSNGAHNANWHHDSRVIKAKASTVDTVSFFVAYGSTPSIALYKCTAINATTGAETWTKQSDVALGVSATGIYNYTVSQNASKVATAAFAGSYTGNYYIRTDASDGGWSNYKTSGANTMTYSEYSVTHGGDFGPYSHYFMRHVNSGSNIKFCIANDYSECISDTVVDDTYAHEWIEVEANVRFMWYYGTNKIGRAYISGSSIISDRFLVLEGDEHLYDADGNALNITGLNANEINFVDDQNWIYETTVQANPLERIKLTAKFNNKIQYFYGAEGDRSDANTHQLIGGTGSEKYKMRVVYDFKTNRLVAAWLPSSAVTTEFDIDADVMIIRYHQADAQQITFSGSGKLKDVQTVYGAMQFNKYRLNNQSEAAGHSDLNLSQYERDLFFISFPFDVKLNDVFGFGQYGKHWIIEYYDGKTRAQNGFWVDSPSNWKFVTKAMKDVFTLKANEGYVLALDLEELTMSSSVWDYGVENVYLYFPSTTTIDKIQATTATVDIDQEGYQCTINRNTPDGDRRVKDSYWHLLGVPSYANATNTTSGSWTGTVPNQDPDTWTSSAPYVYSWNGHTNKFGVISSTSTTFKPMQSYLVQYAKPTIEWASVNATPKAVAARRAQNQLRDCEFRLQLMQNNEELDHTFISLREDEEVTAEFDFSYDLSKMLYGAFTSACNVYTLIGEEQAAANCLPLTEQTTVVPVGLKVADDGEYTFSMPEGTSGVGVTLIDNVRDMRTNLALSDYMVELEAGTYDDRFVLEISPIQQIVTNIEEVTGGELQNDGVRKVMVDGVLYIIKDGKVFDARGARVQ